MERDNRAVFMVLVVGRRSKEAVLTAITSVGVNLIDVIYGKGAVSAGFLQNMLGLIPEENKVVIVSITTRAKSQEVYRILTQQFDFDKPNTGMAFTIPVEAVSY